LISEIIKVKREKNGLNLKMLDFVVNIESKVIGDKTNLELIDEKLDEIANGFSRKYKTADELLEDTF